MRGFISMVLLGWATIALAEDWPQWMGPKRDGVWREDGIVDRFPKGGPKLIWQFPVGTGYAGPAISAGKVFLMDRVTEGTEGTTSSAVRNTKGGFERTICIDQKSGKLLWEHKYPCEYRNLLYASGPRCTPCVDGNRVYTLGAMGQLHCCDTDRGTVVWAKNFTQDYGAKLNVWGFSAHPLIDGNKLICLVGGSGERLVVAFDKKTGEELWSSQSLQSDSGYCPPVIYDLAGRRTLVIWHGRGVVGLDPDSGKRHWYYPWGIRHALTAPMPRQLEGDRLFLTAFYDGPLMLKIGQESQPRVVWKGKGKGEQPHQTDGLHSIIPTPFISNGHIYGVCSYGELRCIKVDSGERVWATWKTTTATPSEEGKAIRWANAFLTPNGDRFFLSNDQGDLIIAKLSPKGYEEIDRAKILNPTNRMANRPVVWSHPGFSDRCVFARDDEKLVCINLAK